MDTQTAMVQGSALAGLNAFDMYLISNERDHILDLLRDRYPHATRDLASVDDWRDKLSGDGVVSNYISAFSGEAGERQAMTYLASQGIEGEQFESLINPDNDQYTADGSLYSVKSYHPDNSAQFERMIEQSEASDYIVNSEVYEQLEAGGRIVALFEQGVSIEDGGFSHLDNMASAIEHISERAGHAISPIFDGVLDDVPVVGAMVLSYSAGRALVQSRAGKLSRAEAIADFGTDAGQLAAASGGAVAGAAAGAAVGSTVFPLAGTAIGGFAGTLVGAVGARKLAGAGRGWIKWPVATRLFRDYARRYRSGLGEQVAVVVSRQWLQESFLKAEHTDAHRRLAEFESTGLLARFARPDIRHLFIEEVLAKLARMERHVQRRAQNFGEWLMDLAVEIGIARFPDDRKQARRESEMMYGAMLATNAHWLFELTARDREQLTELDRELQRSPNRNFARGIPTTEKRPLGRACRAPRRAGLVTKRQTLWQSCLTTVSLINYPLGWRFLMCSKTVLDNNRRETRYTILNPPHRP
jgi:hypothetical protein